jgi:hypothetical protein
VVSARKKGRIGGWEGNVRRIAVFALGCLAVGPALAVVPHEGNYTSKQMAGIAVGYLMSDPVKTCAQSAEAAETLLGKLIAHYGFDKDDIEEDSAFGKRFIAKGRKIAVKDAHDPTFCQDVEFEIEEDGVELLPH